MLKPVFLLISVWFVQIQAQLHQPLSIETTSIVGLHGINQSADEPFIQTNRTHEPIREIIRHESDLSVTIAPGVSTIPQEDLIARAARETVPVVSRRISSRGPLDKDTDSDMTRRTSHPYSRSFPDNPKYTTFDETANSEREDKQIPTEESLNINTAIASDLTNIEETNTTEAMPSLVITDDTSTMETSTNVGSTELRENSTPEPDPVAESTEFKEEHTHTPEDEHHHTPEDESSIRDPEFSRRTDFKLMHDDNENNPHHHPHAERHTHTELEENNDDLTSTEENSEKDLCSSCLCDPRQQNVYCKHEHLHRNQSHHIRLTARMIPKTATSLHIQDFETITITRDTFANRDLELRKITFENIKNLHLVKNSLHFNVRANSNREVAVVIINCGINEIQKETMTQYARSEDQGSDVDLEMTRFMTLHLEKCNISTIRSYAFTQVRLLYFKMSDTTIGHMEDHSFHVDAYEEWVVERSVFPRLNKHTICIRAQMIVVFSKNTFAGLENRSLDIVSSNQVLFEFNSVFYLGTEALMGIVPEARGASMVFLNNTVHNLQNRSLIIHPKYPSHERKILDNNFDISCECDMEERLHPLMGINSMSSFHENETYNTLIQNSLCRRYTSSNIYTNIELYLSENCAPLPLPILISVGIVILVIAVTIIVCVVCSKKAQKAKEEANYLGECCYSHSFSTLNSGSRPMGSPPPFSECGSWERSPSKLQQPWVMAVPEVKTYQETEVNVHYEQTDPLNASIRGSYHESIDFQRRAQNRVSCPFN